MNKNAWDKDDERNICYYTSLIAKYDIDVRALNWGSRESQQLRFSILAQVGQLNGASVLDVGCGMGDFLGWLKKSGRKVEYIGIDITPKMIEVAQQRFPEARFEIGSLPDVEDRIKEHYNFVFASGIFYYRQFEPLEFMKEMVTQMFDRCDNAVAFNSLSAWASAKEPDEFYADPLETIAFCQTLTPWVVLRHDYHLRDFTIYMYRKAQMA